MKIRLLAACTIATALATPAYATDYLTPYAGAFNIAEHTGTNAEALFGLEYRAEVWDYGIRPTVGFSVSQNGGFYGYGGIFWDIVLSDPWILSPNFMVGGYADGDNDSEDLGSAIEFRSGIELDYKMQNEHRVGIAFNHTSNASIGNRNPGSESLLVTYSVPVGGLFKW